MGILLVPAWVGVARLVPFDTPLRGEGDRLTVCREWDFRLSHFGPAHLKKGLALMA
jgi:hypothetical protein